MRSQWRKTRRQEVQELNITAFMNLMVVLVPFLLITAVFSRLAILELNLPGPGDAAAAESEAFRLEVIIRAQAIEVGERDRGLLTVLPMQASGHDLGGLTDYLKRVKARYPDKTDATVLLEPEVAYETLVQVMDTVRAFDAGTGGQREPVELFPAISIGDAPVRAGGG